VRTVSASASFNDAGRSILVDCWRILNARRDLKDPFSKTCALTKTRLISVHGLRKILNQEKSSVPRSPLCKTLFEAFPLLDGPAKMIWSCGQFDQSEGSLYVCRLRRCITASVENVSCSCGHSALDLRRPLRTLSLSIRYILKIIHTHARLSYTTSSMRRCILSKVNPRAHPKLARLAASMPVWRQGERTTRRDWDAINARGDA
jgi:hypothetical protein